MFTFLRRVQWTGFFLLLSCASAQDLKVTSGLVNNQVIQRGVDERASLQISGSVSDKRAIGKFVEARVTQKGAPLAGLDWVPLMKVKNGKWSGDMKGIPTGGPYRLEIRVSGIPNTASIDDFLVGDLWVLAGQSNMEGLGNLIDVQEGQELVHSFTMADQWMIAQEPLHTVPSAADAVHWPKNSAGQPERLTGEKLEQYVTTRKKGAGLGLPFGVECCAARACRWA